MYYILLIYAYRFGLCTDPYDGQTKHEATSLPSFLSNNTSLKITGGPIHTTPQKNQNNLTSNTSAEQLDNNLLIESRSCNVEATKQHHE